MEKKTKLTISGSSKKPIKNIEIAKNQIKNSTVIEKKLNKPLNRSSSYRINSSKPKITTTFNLSLIHI